MRHPQRVELFFSVFYTLVTINVFNVYMFRQHREFNEGRIIFCVQYKTMICLILPNVQPLPTRTQSGFNRLNLYVMYSTTIADDNLMSLRKKCAQTRKFL